MYRDSKCGFKFLTFKKSYNELLVDVKSLSEKILFFKLALKFVWVLMKCRHYKQQNFTHKKAVQTNEGGFKDIILGNRSSP